MRFNLNEEANNETLSHICDALGINLAFICSRDQIPHELKLGGTIINMASHNEPGTHWICCFNNDKHIVYFDSYGMQPPQELVDIIHTNKDKCYWNDLQCQDINSNCCGWWCVAFLKVMQDSNGSIAAAEAFTDMFNPSTTTENDKKMKRLLKKML